MPRLRLVLRGVVQGVGMRPHVQRTANALGLKGFVYNTGGEVEIEAQAAPERLRSFIEQLRQIPAPAELHSVETAELSERSDETSFEIRASTGTAPLPALPPDLAPCPACFEEVTAKTGRRAGYPFTACTRCGPRFSIVEALPYDRAGTTLAAFPLCSECQREYTNPDDRRFHAQAIACPRCGPSLRLCDATGRELCRGADALQVCAEQLRAGKIIALQGVGGFQLLVDALDEQAVVRLRQRKRREQKPFAVLFGDVEEAAHYAALNDAERALLCSPEAPIVLADRRVEAPLAASVAPENPLLGCLLPASPLHYLLARAVARPLVCTSGNFSGEPLCIQPEEALQRLGDIADLFLVHNRPITRPLDDSVARVGAAGVMVMRRGRGYAPRKILSGAPGRDVLALGAELKAAPALLKAGALILGQHTGDLGELATARAFERNVTDLLEFFRPELQRVACDLHPDYGSTRLAEQLAARHAVPLVRVQHHHAHIAGIAAEHGLSGPVLGLAWDGTGYGTDGTIWGGEVLVVDGANMRRFARLPPFPLAGGDRASREPWRSAFGVLLSVDVELARGYARHFVQPSQLEALCTAALRGINTPQTSSVGRLFDAVAALAGRSGRVDFEGQAAMALEFAARRADDDAAYPLEFQVLSDESSAGSPQTLTDFVTALLEDVTRATSIERIGGRFHRALVQAAVRVAQRAGLPRVVLGGGCFQNALLLSAVREALRASGFDVYCGGQVPTNDGGIAAGQAVVAAAQGI